MALTREEILRVKDRYTPAELVEALDCDWEEFTERGDDLWSTFEEEILEILEEW